MNQSALLSILLNVDAYKVSMASMYPPNTTVVYEYIGPRGGDYSHTVMSGTQSYIKEYLLRPITMDDIDEAEMYWSNDAQVFIRKNWEYIVHNHGGYLPVKIKAAPEGSVIPVGNVLLTIENTDPKCHWLPTWLETSLLRAIWYPSTVATQGYFIKKTIKEALDISSDAPETLPYRLHCFGARGVSSLESSVIGGMAHLINFGGTDTIAGVVGVRRYYNTILKNTSVIATEHSIACSYGHLGEREYVITMFENFAKPNTTIALVADSYNVFGFCRMLGTDPEIRQRIIKHTENGGGLVIRPDSGVPLDIICGTKTDATTDEELGVIRILDEVFGSITNSKNFKVLNYVRVLQGDGVNPETISKILNKLIAMNYSAENIFFGMGGQNLQKVDRDLQRYAMKCSARYTNGQWEDVIKNPTTDSSKQSQAGRVTLWNCGSKFISSVNKPTQWVDDGLNWTEFLELVFENGRLVNEISFDKIRQNTKLW